MGELTFYFDICFGRRFPEIVSRARPPFSVEWHESKGNKFKQDMPDDKWLHIVGEKEWVVFSHDRRFHKESASAAAIKHHNIGCFYIAGATYDLWTELELFMKSIAGSWMPQKQRRNPTYSKSPRSVTWSEWS